MKKLIAILITTVITLNIWGAKAYALSAGYGFLYCRD